MAARPTPAPTPYAVAEREIAAAPFMLLTTTICESGPVGVGVLPGAIPGPEDLPAFPSADLTEEEEVVIGPPPLEPPFPPDLEEPVVLPPVGPLPPEGPPVGPPVGPPLPPPGVEPPTTAVPEPATWALMILGFGAVGVALRRRTGVRREPR